MTRWRRLRGAAGGKPIDPVPGWTLAAPDGQLIGFNTDPEYASLAGTASMWAWAEEIARDHNPDVKLGEWQMSDALHPDLRFLASPVD